MPEIDISKLKPAELVFANNILQGLNQTIACQLAFPRIKNNNSAHVKADRLLRNDTIQQYIEQHKQQLQAKSEENVNTLIAKNKEMYELCKQKGHYSAAIKALSEMAKLTGSYTAERPNPEQAKIKAEERQRNRELAKMLESAINAKYNTVHVISTDITESQGTALAGTVAEEQAEVGIMAGKEQIENPETSLPPNMAGVEDNIDSSDNSGNFEGLT
jgi:phage terminase small subunit